jgi:hypothetical protein
MGAAQFKDFTPENISQNYEILAKKVQQMKTANPAQLTSDVNLKPLIQDKVIISNLTSEEKSKLIQFLRTKVPESIPIQQTQKQIKFNLIAPQALGTEEPEIMDTASTAVKQAKQAAIQAKGALAQAKLAVGVNPVISSKSFAEKCNAFEQNHRINPFNKKRVGKYMKPNGYTETLLTNLCKDPKGFCNSKKANKFITNKYCKDIDLGVVVKQQIQQAPIQQAPIQQARIQQAPIQQARIQQVPIQPAQIKQAPIQQAPIQQVPIQPAQIQQVPIQQAPIQQAPIQQARIQQAPIQQARIQQARIQQAPIQPAQIQQAQQAQQIQVLPSSDDILNDYYLQKCNAFKTNPSKNPFNKTNKGRHMVPLKYTQKLLDELCAGPPAFCNKYKGSKRISNKYCTEAPTVTQLKKEVSQQIQQIQQQIKQTQQQQVEEEQDSAEIFIPQQLQTQSAEQSVASMLEKAQLGKWTEKCAQYAAKPYKNPFNKTNRGRHFKPNNYTAHILDELCANPTAYCDKKKANKYISNKYCNL